MSWTLVTGASLALASAALFVYVGRVTGARVVGGDAQRASTLFSWWWYLLAFTTGAQAILAILAAFGTAPLFLHQSVTYITVLVVSAGLAFLLYYLVYIYTGKTNSLWPILAGYAAYAFVLLLYLTYSDPIGVHARRWQVEIQYARPLEGWPLLAVVFLLVGPQFLAAFAYLSLYWRVKSAEKRYRILLVALSIIVWFGASLVGSVTGLSQSDPWQIVTRFVALLAAATVLLAYRPPARIQKRLLGADARASQR